VRQGFRPWRGAMQTENSGVRDRTRPAAGFVSGEEERKPRMP